ncbi:DNA helicase, putative [Plasmodium relictum]|uniref:DNA helicase, putative n=1 Tax=Plasmodium relictum TaxID=85471 RepID=A0A1J1H2W5_PLARL|nr:DNA helicase, putative [Plasmodium relictum]CRG98895.1 DNA helicase, putative [Plasmodium relictum]
MDVFEFVDPLRKRKITNNLFDFDKYIYKDKSEESEEKKNSESSLKKKKKKLRRVLNSSSSDENLENEKNRDSKVKKEKEIIDKKEFNDEDCANVNDNSVSYESDKEEYESSLNHLFECLLISIKIKNKIIEYFTSDIKEKRQEVVKEFVKGSFRISNCDANFQIFENNVDTFHKLKNYQKCGVFWLYILYKEKKNGILADEMGLGKTAQTCVFLDYMYRTKELQNKTIIVAPTSLLKNWNNEINMWCPYLKNHKIIYYGNQNERKYLAYDIFTNQSNNIHLIVTSINMLIGKNDVSYFRQIKKYDYLIFDEAHFLKNKNSLIYKKLQKKIVFNNKILLTGSPIQNKTEELMNLLLFLMPEIFTEKNINSAMNAFVKLYQQILNKKEDYDLEENIQLNKNQEIHDIKSEEEIANSESAKNMIKNYLIQTIKNDVKHVELKNKEIILLQLIIEPYILRRSKKHVFIDMPKKHSVIIKLPLNNTQLNLYKNEIFSKLQHTHKHLEFIQKHSSKKELEKLYAILEKKENKADKLPNELQDNKENAQEKNEEKNDDYDDKEIDEETINIEKAEENKDSNIIINKREDEEIVENNNNNGKDVRGKMINASIFILRRICNHPLLHKYYYSVEDIKNISKYFYNNTDQYLDLDLKTVETEFMKISDFDIHLSIKHLISQGDNNLNKYLITKEHILNSTKIHHMISLIKEIRQKKEKVLIFSQFTTFLDIIEEALLYEFIYDDQDFSDHLQHIKSSQSINKNEKSDEENSENNKDDASLKNKDVNNDENKNEKDFYISSSSFSSSSFVTEEKIGNEIYVRLDGTTNTIERQKIIKRFSKNENIFIFLLSTKAGGVGLNLIAANHVILMDQDWNPHNDRQAEDRVHRLGQKNEVHIYRLCCKNTIEETILKCCKAKLHLDQAFGGNSDLLQTALIKDALNAVDMK